MTILRSPALLLLPCLFAVAPASARADYAFHLVPALVLADLPPATSPDAAAPAAPATPPAAPSAPAVPAPGDFGFDMFDEHKVSPAQAAADAQKALVLEKKGRIRRRVLTAHQAIGFATLALLATTAVLGQLNYDDKFTTAGTYTGKYDTWHYAFSIAATTGFTASGLLGLFAPNPYPKPIKFDTALIHKISMAIATACFLGDIILGPVAAQYLPGKTAERQVAQTHLVLGYGALGFMTLGTLVYVF